MKKLTALLTALLLALLTALLPACAGADGPAEDPLSGEWYLHAMAEDGKTINLAAMGVSGVLTLNPDGTAAISMLGEDMAGTWTNENGKTVITLEGSPAGAVLADGELTVSAGERSMVFSREAVDTIRLAEVRTDAKPEDFDGRWTCVYMGMGPLIVEAAAIATGGGSAPVLVFSDGHMQAENVDESSMFGADPVEMTFADGAYSYKDAKVVLLEDGMLGLIIDLGETVSYYFTRTEAETPAA